MKIDIVIPDNNEELFIKRAKLLEYDGIIFLYDKINKNPLKTKFKIWPAILSNKQVKGIKCSKGSEKNRWIFEKLKPEVVFELETLSKRDKTHYRNSGLDQVLCKMAKQNNIRIGFSLSKIINGDRIILGRICQNIRICMKYKVECFFASFARKPEEMRPVHDVKALSLVLGMTTDFSKFSFKVLEEFVKEKFK